MEHQTEPLRKLKIEPQEDETEFLVDTRADITCILKVPEECCISKKVISVIWAKGERFKVPLIEMYM